jgi:hypothetical protein
MPKAVLLDPDAQAFLTASGITDATITSAINTLVLDLKSYGIWSKMKAIYPFVGGTASSHSYNLVNTAQYQITWNGGITHSSNGVQFGGVNGYGDTGLNANSVLTLNSTSLHFYSRTAGFSTTIMGCDNGTQSTILTPKFSAGANFDYSAINSNTTGIQNTAASSTQGLLTVNRTASNSYKGYRNGISYYTKNANSSSKPNFNIFIGARNSSGSASQYSNLQGALSAIADGLSDTEAANFYTAVQAFQTTLNRQV